MMRPGRWIVNWTPTVVVRGSGGLCDGRRGPSRLPASHPPRRTGLPSCRSVHQRRLRAAVDRPAPAESHCMIDVLGRSPAPASGRSGCQFFYRFCRYFCRFFVAHSPGRAQDVGRCKEAAEMTAASVLSSVVPPTAVDALRGALLGEVLVAGDDGYDAARAVWNAMIDRRPALIARCKGTADVLDAVRFARERGLPVSIRGGGHNVAGHAVADGGLMVDLSAMRAVRVDPRRRRALVEGGATWREVDRETQAFGLAVPGGLISTTGVAGLTLSGGIGWLRSRHGLSIDNLVAADVVTAEGRLVRASTDEHP